MSHSSSHLITTITSEKNELATLIGNFNPSWDIEHGENEAFLKAVQTAGMILVNTFEKYKEMNEQKNVLKKF